MTISQDSSAPLVVVVGATGLQGGSVVKALAETEKPYRVRGLTRNAKKEAAQKLSQKGVEIVEVDLVVENKEKVHKAFEGASYAFIVTQFWEHFSRTKEVAEGKLMVDAAAAAKPKRIIWSGLPDVSKVSDGKYTHVDHCDGKAEVTEYGRTLGIPFSNVQAGAYMSNYLTVNPPRKMGEGAYGIFLPIAESSQTTLIDIEEDYGRYVLLAIESSEEHQDIIANGEVLSYADSVKILREETGKNVNFVQLPQEQWTKAVVSSGMTDHIANDLLEMYKFFEDFGAGFEARVLETNTNLLNPPPRKWREYVKAHKAEFEKIMS